MDGSNTAALAMYLAFYMVLILLFFLWFYTIICRCHGASFSNQNQAVGPTIILFSTNEELPNGLDASAIQSFPKFAYTGMDMVHMDIDMGMKMTGECVVCLGVFEEKEMLRLLPKCGHVFHVDCVDIWLQSHATCPFCRANLLANDTSPEMPTPQEVVIDVEHRRLQNADGAS